ncbi:hypothetical protein EDC04DRAFT_399634 [Pisolithus marmoratus]|nr:hypothetical protein EDC04DRAFT_399634 [Pisolithus marmoratus]
MKPEPLVMRRETGEERRRGEGKGTGNRDQGTVETAHTEWVSKVLHGGGGVDSSALYTYADLKAAVIKYVTTRQLVNAHDQAYANVGQDEVLLSTVTGKNESGDSLEFLKREEVVQRLSEKMQNWYEIRAEGQEPLLRKGQLKPISVVVKTRQGRRANTLISGFEPFLLEAEVMAEELRRICAGSTGGMCVRLSTVVSLLSHNGCYSVALTWETNEIRSVGAGEADQSGGGFFAVKGGAKEVD